MKRLIAVLVAMAVPASAFAQPVTGRRAAWRAAAPAAAPVVLALPPAMAVRSAVAAGGAALNPAPLAPALGLPLVVAVPALAAPALPQAAPAAMLAAPASIMEASEGQAAPEVMWTRAQDSFDGSKVAPSIAMTPMVTVPRKGAVGRLLKRAAAAVPLVLASAGYASAQAPSRAAVPSLPQIAAEAPAFKAAADVGYYIGNFLGLIVDIPRMYSAVKSKNPVALSMTSTVILMAASLVAGVKGFLGQDFFWAWQNIFCGVMPMAVALLASPKTRGIFPTGPGSDKEYSTPVALRRLGVLCLIGGIPALVLSLLGHFYLAPLGAAGASAMVQLILQTAACAGFASSLIPQIIQIKKVKSVEGVSVWFMRILLAMYAGFSLWIMRAVLQQVGPGPAETVGNLDFWKHAVYAVQIFASLYLVRLTLRVMARNK